MTLADIIAFHEKGAKACEAYATVDSGKKREADHYQKRAEWHRAVIKLLLDLESNRLT